MLVIRLIIKVRICVIVGMILVDPDAGDSIKTHNAAAHMEMLHHIRMIL